jgi:hypothetical protein
MVCMLCLGALLLGACTGTRPERRLKYSGMSHGNKMAYTYARFTGIEERRERLEVKQTVALAYAAKVDRGTLTVQVQAPSGATMWEVALSESVDEQQVELTAVPAKWGKRACRFLGTARQKAAATIRHACRRGAAGGAAHRIPLPLPHRRTASEAGRDSRRAGSLCRSRSSTRRRYCPV